MFGNARLILAKLLEGITEFEDAVDALYNALPKWLRDELGLKPGYKDLAARLNALYTHWDKLDVQLAVENLMREQSEDRLAGRFYGAVSKARGKLGIVTGPATHGVRWSG